LGLLQEINRLLQSAAMQRVDEEMCVGFHCWIKPKPKDDATPGD
jgi:hypothetical protein